MRKNPVYSLVVLTVSFLLALGAPMGLGAQSQPQSQYPPPAQTAPGQTPSQAPAAAVQPPPKLLIPAGPDYTKDIPWFPHAGLRPYMPRQSAQPVIVNSPRIDQLIHDGKLYLSVNDAIQLAIENNLDVEVQRYITWIADLNELRAKSGSPIRSAQGFTSVLGAIATPSFDPVVTTNLGWARSSFPVNNPLTSGIGTSVSQLATLTANQAIADFTFTKGFETGTGFSLGFNNTRSSSTSAAVLFDPSVSSNLTIGFSQQLLNGFGFMPNTRYIIEAKNNSQASRYGMEVAVINDVASVENAYWNLVYAVENVKVQQAAITWAEKLVQDNERQLQIGTLAQLDVVSAQSALATNQQNLIVAQTTEQQDETVLLNLITRNPMAADLESVQLIPTDTINNLPNIDIIPFRDAVQEAWNDRPDLLEAQLTLKNDGIEVKATRNALLPVLTLTGQYGTQGLGGNQLLTTALTPVANTRSPIVNSSGQPILVNGQEAFTVSQVPTSRSLLPGGLLDAFDRLWNNKFPSYSFGLNMTLPLRNRNAQADSAQAQIQQREAVVQIQELKNNISEAVKEAQIAMQQGVARVQAAEKATQLQQETLNDEQKKFELGVSTDFVVIQYESNLLAAQGAELQAKVGLLAAIVAFNQALGRTLKVHNITIADAQGGHVTPRAPLIPGTPDPLFQKAAYRPGQN
ncbi:MAG TPA: TolC family protein [Candidatus Acidoferrales bacterium]|nr:TolC family protein [Candidatus Acidoferrales bacterium]